EAWVRGYIDRGFNLLDDAGRDAKAPDQKRNMALAAFDQALLRARRDAVTKSLLAETTFGHGRALDSLKRYREAIADFEEAAKHVSWDAADGRWWATSRLASQMSDVGKQVDALLVAAVNYLDLTPELRTSIGLQNLTSNSWLWGSIAALHADLQKPSVPPTE